MVLCDRVKFRSMTANKLGEVHLNRRTIAAVAMLLLWSMIAQASAWSNDYYAGKPNRFIVGYALVGGYDTYTCAIARHYFKFGAGENGPFRWR